MGIPHIYTGGAGTCKCCLLYHQGIWEHRGPPYSDSAMQGANRWPMYAEYGSITVGVGFEISVKFLRSFSETEILRKFHEK